MKLRIVLGVITMTFVMSLSSIINAQTIRSIDADTESILSAENALKPVVMNAAELKNIISKTDKYVMFRIVNGEVTILGDGRKAIYPSSDAAVGREDIYSVCNKNVLVDLLSRSTDDCLYLTSIISCFTITYGNNLMEELPICPPYCPVF